MEVVPAVDVAETAGLGLKRATSSGEERLGSAEWCGAPLGGEAASLWFKPGNSAPVPLPMVDRLRADAVNVIGALQSAHMLTELLSGDRSEEVDRIADEVGIASRHSRMLPGGKLQHLTEAGRRGRKVLMIGDGLNDAPALAAAHASISPASAADVSQTAADAIFQGSHIAPVLETLAVAREVHRMALQNFAIAIGYNLIFVPLAIAGLVTPLIAAIAMSASSIAVTANAVRLKHKTLRLGTWRSAP